MKRDIDKYLQEWSDLKGRKVLLIRGARQVGKTFSVRRLATTFRYLLEVNFEEDKDVKTIFDGSLNPLGIVEKLSAYYTVPIVPGETLLFLDEIQACPNAISSLRFFYEKMPELHVIGAGSLLEFALSEIPSLGVGRLSNLFMYPLSFFEFLEAVDETGLITMIEHSGYYNPLDDVFHKKLINRLKTYLIIGGMPDVVKKYIDTHDLLQCQTVLDELIVTFIDDFAKYKKKVSVERLEEVFRNVALQSGQKFKYSKIDKHILASLYKDALNLLVKAGVVIKTHHTSANGIPLGAQINPKKFKVNLFDVGLHQRLMGLDLSDFLVSNDFNVVNRGCLAETFTALELLAYSNPRIKQSLYYWHREARSSNAEVDFIIQRNDKIIPLEVKAGTKGQMQSLHLFIEEKQQDYGIRISLENFCEYEKIKVCPMYAIKNIFGSSTESG